MSFVSNLDGPLFICTKEEQRAVIHCLWAEGVPGAKMHRRTSVQYGNGGHSNFICTKKEQRPVILFCGLKVYQVPKYIEGRQYNMGTVDTPISLAPKKSRGQ